MDNVRLDANFSKIGYSAHLRTLENGESRQPPLNDGLHGEKKDWGAERWTGSLLKLYKEVRLPITIHITRVGKGHCISC